MIDSMTESVGNWAGVGVGGVVLILLFRTLWRFSGDASELAKNYDQALARAQGDATAARSEARQAAESSAEAWREVLECERRHLELEATLTAELNRLRLTIARLHPDDTQD